MKCEQHVNIDIVSSWTVSELIIMAMAIGN